MDDIELWIKEELGDKLDKFIKLYKRLDNLIKDMPSPESRMFAPIIQEVKNEIQDLFEEAGVDVAIRITRQGRIEFIQLSQ